MDEVSYCLELCMFSKNYPTLDEELFNKLDVRQHAKRANAHSSTFGFCRHAKSKQKTKRAIYCQRTTENINFENYKLR